MASWSPQKSDALQAWNGVDTVVVCAELSAPPSLLEVVGQHDKGSELTTDDVQRAICASEAAMRGNYTGPLVSAVTLVYR